MSSQAPLTAKVTVNRPLANTPATTSPVSRRTMRPAWRSSQEKRAVRPSEVEGIRRRLHEKECRRPKNTKAYRDTAHSARRAVRRLSVHWPPGAQSNCSTLQPLEFVGVSDPAQRNEQEDAGRHQRHDPSDRATSTKMPVLGDPLLLPGSRCRSALTSPGANGEANAE